MSSLKRWTGPTAFFVCCAVSCFLSVTVSRATTTRSRKFPSLRAQGQVQQSREPAPAIRIPRQQAFNTTALDGVVRSAPAGAASTPVPGARLTLRNLQTGQIVPVHHECPVHHQRRRPLPDFSVASRTLRTARGSHRLRRFRPCRFRPATERSRHPGNLARLHADRRRAFPLAAPPRTRSAASLNARIDHRKLPRVSPSPRFRPGLHPGTRSRLSPAGR